MARRFADGVEHHEVVLAAGGHAVDDHVGDRHVRCGEGLFGLGLLGLGGLDPVGELLGLRRAAPAARRAMPCRPACWPPSARRAGCRRRRSRPGGRCRRCSSASTRPGSSPRARCDARTASGFSRSSLRSITAATLLLAGRPRRQSESRGRHNPITLQLHHLSQHLTRLSQWSGCWRHPNASSARRLARRRDARSRGGSRGGTACRPRRRAARCC